MTAPRGTLAGTEAYVSDNAEEAYKCLQLYMYLYIITFQLYLHTVRGLLELFKPTVDILYVFYIGRVYIGECVGRLY